MIPGTHRKRLRRRVHAGSPITLQPLALAHRTRQNLIARLRFRHLLGHARQTCRERTSFSSSLFVTVFFPSFSASTVVERKRTAMMKDAVTRVEEVIFPGFRAQVACGDDGRPRRHELPPNIEKNRRKVLPLTPVNPTEQRGGNRPSVDSRNVQIHAHHRILLHLFEIVATVLLACDSVGWSMSNAIRFQHQCTGMRNKLREIISVKHAYLYLV